MAAGQVLASIVGWLLPGVRTILVFALVLLLVRLALGRAPRHANLPPGPWGLPLLGANFRLGADPGRAMLAMSQRYGKVFSLYIGPRLTVVISDPELVREAFGKKAEATSARDICTMDWLDVSGSLVASSSSDVKPLRRFLLRTLRDFGLGKRGSELLMLEEARHLCDGLARQEGKTTDPRRLLQMAVSNILCALCFGRRLDYESPEMLRLIAGLQAVSHISGIGLPRDLPLLFLAPRFRDFRRGGLLYRGVMEGVVAEHRRTFDPARAPRDVTDKLIEEVSKGADSRFSFGLDRIYRTLMDLFGAGADTTSSALQFSVWSMAVNQSVQKTVRGEILREVGSGRTPEWKDRHNLPYTCATINEVLRLYHPAPLSLPHRATRTFTLAGYTIPEGAEVWAPILPMNMDPGAWAHPETFDPDRFLSADGKRVVLPEHFMPFSTGSRMCIGEGLARMELFIFFSILVQRFTIELPPGCPASCEPRMGFFQRYPSQMQIRFSPN